MEAKLVALDVPRGSGYDSQSGLNNLFPQVYGRLADEGCGKRIAFVVIHPTSNFMGHYLIGPLQWRGRAVLALNTRYVANDSALIIEWAARILVPRAVSAPAWLRAHCAVRQFRWWVVGCVLSGGGGAPDRNHDA